MSGQHGSIPLQRIEAFSDAVFAFAVTLLVVSLEVPKSAHELTHALRGTLAFGLCFALLATVWLEHSMYFKRYPLADGKALALNMLLLFTVLTYVYPMKFLFSFLVDELIFRIPTHAVETNAEVRSVMVIFGLGAFAVNAMFFLMHRHAAGRADAGVLHLNDEGRYELRRATVNNVMMCAIALASIAIASLFDDHGAVSGPIYMLNALARPMARRMARRSGPVAAH